MLSRVFRSSALLKEPRRVAHELNAIGLSAKVASIFGVNPMFLVNASRVGFESAGTCSGFGAAVLGIVVSFKFLVSGVSFTARAWTRQSRIRSRPALPDGA